LANFLEKVSYRICVCPPSAQKEKRNDKQGNPARPNEVIDKIVGVQCEAVIVRHNCTPREEYFLSIRPSVI
jgi:hypothetical protein